MLIMRDLCFRKTTEKVQVKAYKGLSEGNFEVINIAYNCLIISELWRGAASYWLSIKTRIETFYDFGLHSYNDDFLLIIH